VRNEDNAPRHRDNATRYNPSNNDRIRNTPAGTSQEERNSNREYNNRIKKWCKYCKYKGHEIHECRKREFNNRQKSGNEEGHPHSQGANRADGSHNQRPMQPIITEVTTSESQH